MFSGSWRSLGEGLLWDHVLGLEEVRRGSWEISRARNPESPPQATQFWFIWTEFLNLTLHCVRTNVVPVAVMKLPSVEKAQVTSIKTKARDNLTAQYHVPVYAKGAHHHIYHNLGNGMSPVAQCVLGKTPETKMSANKGTGPWIFRKVMNNC